MLPGRQRRGRPLPQAASVRRGNQCFEPGDLGLPVFETRWGIAGICVSYDPRFRGGGQDPGPARHLAAGGEHPPPDRRQPDPTAGDWTASAVNTSRQMPQPDTPDAQTRRSRAVSGHAPNGSARCRGLTRRPDGSDAADCGMMTPWPSSGLVADADHPASPRGAAAQFLQSKPDQLFLQTLRLLQGRVDCPENDSPGVVLTCSAGRPPEPGLPGRAFCDR